MENQSLKISDCYRKKGFPLITTILTIFCLLISLATYIEPIAYNFLALWTNDLKPWQLISYLFENPAVPKSTIVLYLIINLSTLIPFGMLCEKILGKLRTFFIFLIEWIVASGIYIVICHGKYRSFAGISPIVYAFATIAFIYFLTELKNAGKQLFGQLCTYFFITEFVCLIFLLNPFVFGEVNMVVNLSGILVGVVIGTGNRKKFVIDDKLELE